MTNQHDTVLRYKRNINLALPNVGIKRELSHVINLYPTRSLNKHCRKASNKLKIPSSLVEQAYSLLVECTQTIPMHTVY